MKEHLRKVLILAGFFFTSCLLATTAALADDVVLAQSRPIVAESTSVQRISDSIDLKKGQEKLRLILTYQNGTDNAPGFKWLRISSSSMRYVTEQSFQGKTCTIDVSGELTWGGNQLLITAEGPKGATFSWKLTTPQPTIDSVTPSTLTAGSAITIRGANFSPDPTANDVTIDGHEAQCISAAPDHLVVKVPEYVSNAQGKLNLTVAGFDAGTVAVSMDLAPSVTRLSANWVPPGNQFTIYGSGFSPDATSNVVYIGPLRAQVVSSSVNSITVIAPVEYGGQPWGFYQPVKVMVNGVRARGNLTVSISQVG